MKARHKRRLRRKRHQVKKSRRGQRSKTECLLIENLGGSKRWRIK